MYKETCKTTKFIDFKIQKYSVKVKFLSSNRRDVFQYDAKLSENEDLETR